jgi:hypothetical protein
MQENYLIEQSSASSSLVTEDHHGEEHDLHEEKDEGDPAPDPGHYSTSFFILAK